MLYGLLLNLDANAIYVYSTLTDMRDAVRFTAGTMVRFDIRSPRMPTSVEPVEHCLLNIQSDEAKVRILTVFPR